MFIEILIILFFGIVIGLLIGLVPGIHPNTIVLFVPIFLTMNINPVFIMVFIISMAVSNIIADFIPSLLFGAAENEYTLAIHPAQKMLMCGKGFDAIRLSITGALGSLMLIVFLMPLLVFAAPGLYEFVSPFIHYILISIVFLMLYNERNKILSFACFAAAGFVGLLAFRLPIDNILVLFPVFVGLFCIPPIVLKMKNNVSIPEQKINRNDNTPFLLKVKAIILGTFGGLSSGFLPGVGTNEIASLATLNKDNRSFLIIIGSIAMTNIVLSFFTIFLINKARSGVAVAVSSYMKIGFNEMILMIPIAFISVAISALFVLFISKVILKKITEINLVFMNKIVLIVLIVIIYIFTGFYGIFLAGICTVLGVIVMLNNVKRGLLMGVLILPTIIFFIGQSI